MIRSRGLVGGAWERRAYTAVMEIAQARNGHARQHMTMRQHPRMAEITQAVFRDRFAGASGRGTSRPASVGTAPPPIGVGRTIVWGYMMPRLRRGKRILVGIPVGSTDKRKCNSQTPSTVEYQVKPTEIMERREAARAGMRTPKFAAKKTKRRGRLFSGYLQHFSDHSPHARIPDCPLIALTAVKSTGSTPVHGPRGTALLVHAESTAQACVDCPPP